MIKTKALKKYITIKSVCLIIIIMGFLTTFNVYINNDEPFTMSMMTHHFSNIFKIDLLDVHPPLYYFLLKLFLSIFTFWTTSIAIKIVFAKIFSLIFYVIACYFLIRMMRLINVHIDSKLVLIMYLLVPNIITYSLQVRMYELTTMFLVIELYELIKFDTTNNSVNIMLSVLCALLASYSHYFGAISAGTFLLIYFIRYILIRNRRKLIKTFLSGIIFVLLFLPCMIFAYRQISYVMSNKYSNLMGSNLDNNFLVQVLTMLTGLVNINNLLILLLGIFILLINLYVIYYSVIYLSSEFNSILLIVILDLSIGVLIPAFVSIVGHPMFQARYLYPIASIYLFFLIVIVSDILKSNINISKIFIIILLVLILLINIKDVRNNINEDIRAQQSFHIAKMWNGREEYINCHKYSGNETDLLVKEAVYSKYIKYHPKLYVKHLRVSQILGSNNRKLLHSNFNNIYLMDKSK